MIELKGRVTGCFVGDGITLETTPKQYIEVDEAGVIGDKHRGFTRPAGGREPKIQRGTPIENKRMWSGLSLEELIEIATNMNLPQILPAWLGANVAFENIPKLTLLPKGTKIIFPDQAILVVTGENLPCTGPGEVIAKLYTDRIVKPNTFPKAAKHLRGIVGTIEQAGVIRVKDTVTVQILDPKFTSWPPSLKA